MLAIGAGLIAVLWHSVWRTAVRATLVVVTVAALSVSVVAWDQVPPAAPSCSERERPISDYCYKDNGTLVWRWSRIQNECGAREYGSATREFRGLWPQWRYEGGAVACEL